AQGDACVHVAAEIDVAHGAAVGPAAVRLQLVDDLHGSDLRGAAQCPGGKAGAQGVESRLARLQPAGHVAAEVHDVAVFLDGHDVTELHSSVTSDSSHIVAAEV